MSEVTEFFHRLLQAAVENGAADVHLKAGGVPMLRISRKLCPVEMPAPTDEQIAAIPAAERDQYILQERVSFTPVIDTPFGLTQAELRIMFVRDDDRYRAVLPLIRMGRGKMMGVDHNKGLDWVGASAAFMTET